MWICPACSDICSCALCTRQRKKRNAITDEGRKEPKKRKKEVREKNGKQEQKEKRDAKQNGKSVEKELRDNEAENKVEGEKLVLQVEATQGMKPKQQDQQQSQQQSSSEDAKEGTGKTKTVMKEKGRWLGDR